MRCISTTAFIWPANVELRNRKGSSDPRFPSRSLTNLEEFVKAFCYRRLRKGFPRERGDRPSVVFAPLHAKMFPPRARG